MLHIHFSVGNALGTVDEHGDVVRMSGADDACHVVDGAEGVVHMPHADELGAWRDEAFEFAEDEVAVLVDGDGTEFSLGWRR